MAAHRDRTRRLYRFHLTRTAVWTIQIPVALGTGLKESVPYLVFLSLAALVEGAFSAAMATRAEMASE